MKTMCHPGYHHNDFVATHALGYMMYRHIIHSLIHYYYIIPLHSCDYLKKLSIQINAATDEGNGRNEI